MMVHARRAESALAEATNTQRPLSPTLSAATTQASALNMLRGPDVIITRAHLRTSVQAYEELLRSSTAYREALSTVSVAAAGFASALETCSRLKGVSDEASVSYQACAGLNFLIGNHERVLSDSIRTQFDEPLKQHLQMYRLKIAERSSAYEQSLIEKNRMIRKTEDENMSVSRRRQRDLTSFRAALATLQRQVADLDQLKAEYYTEVLAHEEETWDFVMEKVALVVRSSLEVYDRIATKSSDPSLEPILQTILDPFDSYGPQKSEDQIYSILHVGSILNNRSSSSLPSPRTAPTAFTADAGHDRDVRSWIDKNAAARDDIPSSTSFEGWESDPPTSVPLGAVDWTDESDPRVRRHSLPTASHLAAASSSKPSMQHVNVSGVSSSYSVPFPSDSPTSKVAEIRKSTKLRHTLSVIGEGGSSVHSREASNEIDAGDDDDTSTERGSDGSHDLESDLTPNINGVDALEVFSARPSDTPVAQTSTPGESPQPPG